MLGYEETGFLLGVGDRMRRERAGAQAVVNQVAAERDEWMRVAWHNKAVNDEQSATIRRQNARIAQLEAQLRRRA